MATPRGFSVYSVSVDPGDYVLRRSQRARRVRISVSARDGLVVTIPAGFPARRVPGLLRSRQDWIAGALVRVESQRNAHLESLAEGPPTSLELHALGQRWSVRYRQTSGAVRAHEVAPLLLSVTGDIDDAVAVRKALRRWLRRKADVELTPRLFGQAERVGVDVARVTWRWQTTRWGSCSRSGSISLNAQLLFLQPEVADYVLLHEVSHVRHPDHSARFWAFVRSHEPRCSGLRGELRSGWGGVPAWLQVRDEA